jgi:hypothetical protein
LERLLIDPHDGKRRTEWGDNEHSYRATAAFALNDIEHYIDAKSEPRMVATNDTGCSLPTIQNMSHRSRTQITLLLNLSLSSKSYNKPCDPFRSTPSSDKSDHFHKPHVISCFWGFLTLSQYHTASHPLQRDSSSDVFSVEQA